MFAKTALSLLKPFYGLDFLIIFPQSILFNKKNVTFSEGSFTIKKFRVISTTLLVRSSIKVL